MIKGSRFAGPPLPGPALAESRATVEAGDGDAEDLAALSHDDETPAPRR
jgi:hypothetical protein